MNATASVEVPNIIYLNQTGMSGQPYPNSFHRPNRAGMNPLDKRAAYLHEVSSCGGVRAAAEYLHINPSAVSRHIRRLEEELGLALVERQGRHVHLTEAGHLSA